MSPSVGISLGTIPSEVFTVSIEEYASRLSSRRCPGITPEWVADAVDDGLEMDLSSLLFQAGQHFSRWLNPTVVTGSATSRQKAMALAWALFSMVSPYVKSDQLWVKDIQDLDIKRLCSEILGVGAALQVLIQCGAIDGRTIDKLGGRFDFEAKSPVDRTTVYIEAKGTFNGGSLDRHRASFSEKLSDPGVITAQNPRGYSRAIGVIFSIWTDNCADRKADVELLDPEHRSEDTFEEMVRDVISFYATVLDEAVGKPIGAARLFEASKSPDLFRSDALPPIAIFNRGRFPLEFHRSTIRLISDRKSRTFMGSFWEARGQEALALIDPVRFREHPYQYVGIDRDVWASIEDRNFDLLLSLHKGPERLFEVKSEAGTEIYYLDRYGVLRAWLDRIPADIDFQVSGEL
jgi:hypothetical protein